MTDLFNKLYSQFLSGKTNQKDFEDFKDSLNHLSDQELSERMESFWNENTIYPPMEAVRKREIHRNLRLQINPPKTSIRWSRIVAAVAVIADLHDKRMFLIFGNLEVAFALQAGDTLAIDIGIRQRTLRIQFDRALVWQCQLHFISSRDFRQERSILFLQFVQKRKIPRRNGQDCNHSYRRHDT